MKLDWDDAMPPEVFEQNARVRRRERRRSVRIIEQSLSSGTALIILLIGILIVLAVAAALGW